MKKYKQTTKILNMNFYFPGRHIILTETSIVVVRVLIHCRKELQKEMSGRENVQFLSYK